jgi:arylsulfatase B
MKHLIFLLIDDLGYNLPGWGTTNEILMPHVSELRSTGLTLTSAYSYQFCSPSRAAFLSGRWPYQLPQTRTNFLPSTVPDSTPKEYLLLPKKLAQNDEYYNVHIGKWHLGMYTNASTPLGRGFNYSYGFLVGGEDHFNQQGQSEVLCNNLPQYDIWENNWIAPQYQGLYTAYQFNSRAVDIITHYNTSEHFAQNKSLFLYYAMHNTHGPIQAEQRFIDLYPNITDKLQQTFYAMVSTVDEATANITKALKESNMFDETLLVWMADNGSPIQVAGSNNPLRGCKGSNWEGGTRVPALVNGGLLSDKRRGKVTDSIVHIVDFYATFADVANVNASDPNGPDPVVDSLTMWPYLSGASEMLPRDAPDAITILDHSMYRNVTTGAIRIGNYKLLVGGSFTGGVDPSMGEWAASWYGEFSPNSSFAGTAFYACPPSNPCLFDVKNDPTEHVDLSATNPELTAQMLNIFYQLNLTYHPPVENPPDDKAGFCAQAFANQVNGKLFISPWK